MLLAALAGTALVASRLLETAPRVPPLGAALVPTGIDTLTPETGGYARVVADGNGIFWAREADGRLVRFDPATGSGRAWTVSDDVAFSMTDILPPGPVGSGWSAADAALVRRRCLPGGDRRSGGDRRRRGGGRRQPVGGDRGRRRPALERIVVEQARPRRAEPGRQRQRDRRGHGRTTLDRRDHAVAAPPDAGGVAQSGWVSRHDGSSWTTFDANDAAALGGRVFGDRAASQRCRLGGHRRQGSPGSTGPLLDSTPTALDRHGRASVAAGPDGAIWAAAGDYDGAVTVRRFDGRSWVSYGPSDGLPAGGERLRRRMGAADEGRDVRRDRRRHLPAVGRSLGAGLASSFAPMALQTLLALSRDELWAIGEKGLWHHRQGAWTSEPIDPRHPEGVVHALILAPDGTLWARGTDGVAYRRDGRWSSPIRPRQARSWWAGTGRCGPLGAAARTAGCEVRTLRFDGSAWVSRAIAACPDFGVSSLAIDATGALLAGTGRGGGGWGGTPGGVARFDGRSWETIPEIGGSKIDGATILGTTPDGDVWVAADVANVTSTPSPPGAGAGRGPGRPLRRDELDHGGAARGRRSERLPCHGSRRGFVDQRADVPRHGGWPRACAPRRRGMDVPFAATPLPWLRLASVAPDGTVSARIASSIVRLPARRRGRDSGQAF